MLNPVYRGGKPRLKYANATTRVVCDGNSLMAGANSSSTATALPGVLQTIAPISGQLTITNYGIGGQSTNNMRGLSETSQSAPNPSGGDVPGSAGHGDIDGSWVNGKTNVLIVWEGTNSIYGAGWTGLQAAAQMASYIAEVKAVHPWRVVLITTLPRWADPYGRTNQAANNELRAYDAYLLANYKAMGADAVVYLRAAGSPFNIPTNTLQDFETPTLWGTNGVGGMWSLLDNSNNADTTKHTHLQDAGFAYVARLVASALGRLEANPTVSTNNLMAEDGSSFITEDNNNLVSES